MLRRTDIEPYRRLSGHHSSRVPQWENRQQACTFRCASLNSCEKAVLELAVSNLLPGLGIRLRVVPLPVLLVILRCHPADHVGGPGTCSAYR